MFTPVRHSITLLLGLGMALGLQACGDDSSPAEETPSASTEATESTAAEDASADDAAATTAAADPTDGDPAASGAVAIDCAAIDRAQVEAITELPIAGVEPKEPDPDHSYRIGTDSFSGARTGCDIDLKTDQTGLPELSVEVLHDMEDRFFTGVSAAVEEDDSLGFEPVSDVGESAFLFHSVSWRSDLLVDVGAGTYVEISLGYDLGIPAPPVADMVAVANLVLPAIA